MLQTIAKSEKRSVVKLSGSQRIVLEGSVDARALHPIHRSQFRFAFGVGTFSDEKETGEAIILEDKPTVSFVREGGLQTETKSTFSSPFLCGVDSRQPVGAFAFYKASSPTSLNSLYEKLIKEYREGFFLVGYASAQELHSKFLKKPPIFQENIVATHADYFSPILFSKNQPISFVGLVMPVEAGRRLEKPLFDRLFSYSETDSYFSHTLVGLHSLKTFVMPKELHQFFEFIKNSSLKAVHHMVSTSMVEEGAFSLFPIEEIVSIEKPTEGPKMGRETLRYPFQIAPGAK